MKHPIRAAALAAGALLCFGAASQAFADITLVDIAQGNSWIATYNVATVFNGNTIVRDFDRFTVTQVSDPSTLFFTLPSTGDDFETGTSPVRPLNGFSDTNFTQDAGATSTFAAATSSGSPIHNLTFDLHWNDPSSTGGAFNILFFNGATQVAHGWVWAAQINNQNIEQHFLTYEVVPVPAALWTGLPMLGGMIFLIRRNKRRVLA